MSGNMLRMAAFVVGLWIIASFQAKAASPTIYNNTEFGIHSVISRAVCLPLPGQHDHGFAIPLDQKHMNCDEVLDHAFLSVIGEYNALFDTDNRSLLKWLCDSDHGWLARAPAKLAIRHHVSASGLCTLAGHWVELFVVTQTGQSSGDEDSPKLVPYINIILTLYTPLQELHKNIRVLEEQLRVLRITTVEPGD
jgi:hypothetical protein